MPAAFWREVAFGFGAGAAREEVTVMMHDGSWVFLVAMIVATALAWGRGLAGRGRG